MHSTFNDAIKVRFGSLFPRLKAQTSSAFVRPAARKQILKNLNSKTSFAPLSGMAMLLHLAGYTCKKKHSLSAVQFSQQLTKQNHFALQRSSLFSSGDVKRFLPPCPLPPISPRARANLSCLCHGYFYARHWRPQHFRQHLTLLKE